MIGNKLAHYEITSHLGTGGMGEVYQATDSKLGRSVAIKLLPEAFTHDAERAARFEREARVLASLNHSNIAAIFGLEESGDRKFLVMELVAGETLADRIKRGPIPVDESLGIAKQICEALEAAHEKGIIHRDLKPANVKITPKGKVKVLDFGLAKAYEAEASKTNLSQSPTLSMAATNAGVILGTAAYMSPEQAKGRQVDQRTDIFSFGCVLFEMLTGRPAFEGEDVTDILSAVVRMEPDWTRLPAGVPPEIRKLLRLCLEKDVTKRRRDAGDVRIDIEQALTEREAAMLAVTPTRSTSLASVALAFAAIIIVALAIPALRHLREIPLPETRLEIVTPATSDPASFALSLDGHQIVFVASGDGASRLWLRSLASTTAQPLAGTEGAAFPFWSPDSRSIGFFADSKLKRLDIGGGAPQTLAAVTTSARGGTWNADGVILFSPITTSGLFRVPASGGQAVAVTKLVQQTNHRLPFFLPDSRQFLFLAQGAPEATGIYLGSLDSAQTWRLAAAATAGGYLSSGLLLWVRDDGTLVAQRLDLERKALTGDPVTLADSVSAVSVSAADLVAYRSGRANRGQLTWFDRTGKALGLAGDPNVNNGASPELSPDGRRIAIDRTIQGNRDVWLMDLARGGLTRFTFDTAVDGFPLWSPDGSRIVFESTRKGSFDIWLKPSSGAGMEELLLATPNNEWPLSWAKDGRFLLYYQDGGKTQADLWALPMTGDDRKPILVANTPFDEFTGEFSPDGRWVAYDTNESGRFEIVVQPFPKPTGKWQVSTSGGIRPRWRSDGKELYFIAPDGKLMAVPVAGQGLAFEAGTPAALFPTRILGTAVPKHQYAVSPNGRFLMNQVIEEAGGATPITLIQNWRPPAK
jgi:eukaryotic-like serine/threonine-protein kinase